MTKHSTDRGKAFGEGIEAPHKDGTIGKPLTKYGLNASAATQGAPRFIEQRAAGGV